MLITLRIVTGVLGLLLGVQAVQWMFMPATAAESLAMPLLEGAARSSQMGDTGAFFLGASALIFLGVIRMERPWLQAAALLVGLAAAFRTLAWALHDAPFTAQFVIPELVMLAVLVTASIKLPRSA